MKYIKFFSVSIIVLTIEIIMLNIIEDGVVIHKWHVVIQFIIIACYVGAFCVLNGEIIDVMITEWFVKPKQYEDLDVAVNGNTSNDDVLDRVLDVDIDDLTDDVIVIHNLNVIEQQEQFIKDVVDGKYDLDKDIVDKVKGKKVIDDGEYDIVG